jgi:hypothetical protein
VVFWPRERGKKWVAPAQLGVLPVSKSNAAPRATSMLPTTSRHPPGDAKGEAQGDDPVSRTLHLFTLEMRLKLFGIGTPLLLKRL